MQNLNSGTSRNYFIVDGVKLYGPKSPDAHEVSALMDVSPGGEIVYFSLWKNVQDRSASQNIIHPPHKVCIGCMYGNY